MDELQKWLSIAALWIVAIGIFMLGMGSRYAPFSGSTTPIALDRWTGHLVAKGFVETKAQDCQAGYEKLLEGLKIRPTATIPSGTSEQKTEP